VILGLSFTEILGSNLGTLRYIRAGWGRTGSGVDVLSSEESRLPGSSPSEAVSDECGGELGALELPTSDSVIVL
jgi:hypothetical protein